MNFGNTPFESLVDTDFVSGRQGHGTEVAGIVGANNRSDPALGLDYECPAMNGIISGVPNILGKYTLEERIGPAATLTTALANAIATITSGARIVLAEIMITARTRLSAGQLSTGNACFFSAMNDLLDLELGYRRWSNLFGVHPDVLFVLPAGNYDQELPKLTSTNQFADVVSLVGGINRDNTITVGAFDPLSLDRAVWFVTPSGVMCLASDFGPGVDIAAPGSHVFAPKPTDLAHLTANDFYINSFQGTSASAPFVAGAAALLYAIDPALPTDPSKVPLHLKNTLVATADPLLPAFPIGNRLNVCRAAKTTLGAQFQLSSANPNNSAVNVAVNISAILLNFSLPINATTLPTSFLISGSGQPPTGALQISDDKRSVLFVPSQGLQAGTVYHVDLSTVKDVCGDSLPAGTNYAFTTVAPVISPPDLTITKTASPSSVASGGTLTYTITAQNAAGTADALNVTVTDALPTGVSFTSCSVSTGGCSALNGTVTTLFGTLAGGGTAMVTVMTTAPTVTSSTTVTNTATVSTTSVESNTANNTASQTTTVNSGVANWTQHFPTTSPPPLTLHAMAYDAARTQVVVFGGNACDPTTGCTGNLDTWVWDGVVWTRKSPGTTPTIGGGMAYDSGRSQTVLFGWGCIGCPTETWIWDGTTWVQRFPQTSPSARNLHSLVYDAARGQVVLFGGYDFFTNSSLGDTWVWDGSNWTQKFPATNPPARDSFGIAYDAARARVVIFGGEHVVNGNGLLIADTWVWDGSNWTQAFPVTNPEPKFFHAMAYDAAQSEVVLFGGWSFRGANDYGVANDTWTWDGSDWKQQSPGTSPAPRWHHAMAYDAAHSQIVLFGGDTTTGSFGVFDDTWIWANQ